MRREEIRLRAVQFRTYLPPSPNALLRQNTQKNTHATLHRTHSRNTHTELYTKYTQNTELEQKTHRAQDAQTTRNTHNGSNARNHTQHSGTHIRTHIRRRTHKKTLDFFISIAIIHLICSVLPLIICFYLLWMSEKASYKSFFAQKIVNYFYGRKKYVGRCVQLPSAVKVRSEIEFFTLFFHPNALFCSLNRPM